MLPTAQFNGFTQYLTHLAQLDKDKVKQYCLEAQKSQCSLLSYLVAHQLIDSHLVAENASKTYDIPFFDLDTLELSTLPVNLLNEKLIRQHNILPLYVRDKSVCIAVSDPTNLQALDDIKFHCQLSPETVLVEEDKLSKILNKILNHTPLKTPLKSPSTSTTFDDDIDEAPIVQFVNKLLLDAVQQGASDIHLEPYENNFRIRFRIDGILRQITSPTGDFTNRIISRIKVMAKMDIAERRIPQDGRIKLYLPQQAIDFRVNSCPTLFGEKIVLRILDPNIAKIGIEKLGFEPEQKALFLTAIHKPYGMILVTGPTGSGKTVTLYTALNLLNQVERNICTAEDPVEITVEGINQVNINVKSGLTFANTLRAFLRQDPDVIMVGEIRDLETADIAVKAAQTGHLVLSTLHTNDVPQTLNRLLQMGVEPFNLASAIILMMAQRLARRLCEHCKVPTNYPEALLIAAGFNCKELPTLKLYAAKGCPHCKAGYQGRIGIFQVMMLSEAMRTLILTGGNALEIATLAQAEGIKDLRASGLNKLRLGVTSLEEIDRVTTEQS